MDVEESKKIGEEESDDSIFNVDSMIKATFGPFNANVINFKLLQTILHIMAHRVNMLEQEVDIKFIDRKEYLRIQEERKTVGTKKGKTKDLLSDQGSEASGKKDKSRKETSPRTPGEAEKKKYKLDGKDELKDKDLRDGKDKLGKKHKLGKKDELGDKDNLDGENEMASKYKYDEKSKLKKDAMSTKEKSKSAKMDVSEEMTEAKEREIMSQNLDEDDNVRIQKGLKGKADKDGKPAESAIMQKEGKRLKETVSFAAKLAVSRESIELATRPQLRQLKTSVKMLLNRIGPVPAPKMPDSKQIREAISKGTTTLPGAMEAIQLSARVAAAEQALSKMTELLVQMAELGVLPSELTFLVDLLKIDRYELSQLTEAAEKGLKEYEAAKTRAQAQQTDLDYASVGTSASGQLTLPPPDPFITKIVMNDALENMKLDLKKMMTTETDKSTATAKQAANMVQSIESKVIIGLAVNDRIDSLNELTAKNVKQLSGFDAGLNITLGKFQEQMKLMQEKLKGGLPQKTNSTTIIESEVVTNLRSGQERMEHEIERFIHYITDIMFKHKELVEEVNRLRKAVNMVGDEKVDKEDLVEQLKKKLDLNRLSGLLKEEVFENNRQDLSKQIDMCFQIFDRRSHTSMSALGGLLNEALTKAQYLDVYTLKDFASTYLTDIRNTLTRLEELMGDPKVALLTRQLSRNSYCASCLVSALMVPVDKCYGMPPKLPELPKDFSLKDHVEPAEILRPPDDRMYICKRWFGGSHTKITQFKIAEKLPLSELEKIPTRAFAETAADGRIYMMQEDLPPCVECNQLPVDKPEEENRYMPAIAVGAGDQRLIEDSEYNPEIASVVSIPGSN